MKGRIAATVLLLLGGRPVLGVCPDPSVCYCDYRPDDDEYLIRAEVTGLLDQQEGVVLVVESIYKLPDSPLLDVQIGGKYECDFGNVDTSLAVGDAGLFVTQYWSSGGWYVLGYLLEENGLYPCTMVPEFRGATEQELVEVLLADDCTVAAKDLGLALDCDDGGCWCAAGDSKTGAGNGSLLVVLILVALLLARSRRGPGASR